MNCSLADIQNLVLIQRNYFNTGVTLPVDFRIRQLKKLKEAILFYQQDIKAALKTDLARSETESYLLDIGTTISEINEAIHNLKKWAKPETHFSGFIAFPSLITKVYKLPYGVTLIISPYNFPFVLSFGVLTASIAGGNTAVIKVSSKVPNCYEVIKKIVERAFPPEYVSVVFGPHEVADYCLEQHFDKIFYTGSPKVGKHVLALAAQNLTPVSLELGGETGNWCIVRKDADLKDAAEKIAFAKICNSGQICININQVAIAQEVADEFVELLKNEFIRQIGAHPLDNEEYGKLIDQNAYQACYNEVEKYRDRVVFGGKGNRERCQFEPTVLYPIEIHEDVVNHELFCPILPVVVYPDKEIDEIVKTINERPHPLALYIFTKDIKWAEKVMSESQFGGGCINEVLMQFMVKNVPFNGTGHSGMGAYHGIWGFREFTHPQTVVKGTSLFNLKVREHPYNNHKLKEKIIRLFEK
ncbi:MAG: aldehyde dehydrogenase family protein [Erysipelotrichaceae bacterium]